ncbi:hypothetical protein R3P38DRAFT_3281047 [Favolaschia claudopus]|uniref:F-box domain-containing protein n=1 Tax=Favolaschia claudopus TaxID=2862362 RepID=A0AAW0AFH1_9AGAR
MHRALEITEIVSSIVSECQSDPWSSFGGLAALARCQIFHEQAMDLLWKDQVTILNLIRCLPDDVLTVKNQGHSYELIFHRNPHPSDWTRVLYYGRRVRSCGIDHTLGGGVKKVFQVLRTRASGDYLLPNLVELRWRPVYSIESYTDIDLFLGPMVSSISIFWLSAPTSVLDTIVRTRPSISTVRIYDIIRGETLPEQLALQSRFSSFACSLPNLTSLSLDICVDTEAILHLGKVPHLKRLVLGPPAHPRSSLVPSTLPTDLFPDLEIFSFTGKDEGLVYLTTLVRSWANPPLESFRIVLRCKSHPTSASVNELLCAVSEHCSHDALQRINLGIHVPADQGRNNERVALTGRAIQHLLPCSFFTDVTFHLSAGYRVDDHDILMMAMAWPKLRRLRFTGNADRQSCDASLQALISLAKHCRDLNILVLTFDATRIPPLPPHEQLLYPPLTTFDVGDSLIVDAQGVAGFIYTLFPSISELETSLENDDLNDLEDRSPEFAERLVCHKVWKAVEERLRDFQAIELASEHEGRTISS